MTLSRRQFIKWASASAVFSAATFPGLVSFGKGASPHVVVIGGGYAGATAAKYIKLWGSHIDVTLVESDPEFISCPLSNLVLGGSKSIRELTVGYEGLARHQAQVVHDEARSIDVRKRTVQLAHGGNLSYDRVIVAPGVHFMYERIPGLNSPDAQKRVLHAWNAGAQTVALRKQLEAMPDGGVYALCIPESPYRCPPGPYERACQVAYYFKTHKPRSKVLVLDANEDVQSEKELFTAAWAERYSGIVEYRPNSVLVDVDVGTLTAKLEFENVKAAVLNVVPPQRAGIIAQSAGLITTNNRWCDVDFLTYESTVHKNIHVLGDAILAAPAMPKSGHMANQQAKVCAAAVVALLSDQPINERPMMNNACYSFISDREAAHLVSVHEYDPKKKTMLVVAGSSGRSAAASVLEGNYGWGWAQNIWADMLA